MNRVDGESNENTYGRFGMSSKGEEILKGRGSFDIYNIMGSIAFF